MRLRNRLSMSIRSFWGLDFLPCSRAVASRSKYKVSGGSRNSLCLASVACERRPNNPTHKYTHRCYSDSSWSFSRPRLAFTLIQGPTHGFGYSHGQVKFAHVHPCPLRWTRGTFYSCCTPWQFITHVLPLAPCTLSGLLHSWRSRYIALSQVNNSHSVT